MNPPRRAYLTKFLALLIASAGPLAAADWILSDAQEDESKRGDDGKPSLRINPGGMAELPLREENGSGRVSFQVFEDGNLPVEGQPKLAGPRWGIVQSNGRVLVAGIMYAPYVTEGGALCLMDVDPAVEGSWYSLMYLGDRPQPGWHKWEFEFDPDKGVAIFVDGNRVEEKRFNWEKSQVGGFRGLVFYGDETGKPDAQTLWVQDVQYELGGPMKVEPQGPDAASQD